MMTALVTLQHADLDDVFRASNYDPAPIESQIGLRPGERMSVRDLMRGLLLPSGNDAAMALAVGVSGSRNAFVRAMNTDAEQLGLRDTHFANPIGLDAATNYSTAADLAKLAVVLRRNDFARETMDRRRATLQTGSRERTVVNRNTLVQEYPWVNGVKTGHTNSAGYLLVGSATRNGITVVSVVMGEPSEAARDADSLTLLRYGLSSFSRRTGLRKDAVLARPKLAYRDEHVDLVASSAVQAVVRRGQRFTRLGAGRPVRAARADPRRGTDRHRGRAPGRAGRRARAAPHGGAGQRGLGRRPLQGRERPRDPRRGRSVARGR